MSGRHDPARAAMREALGRFLTGGAVHEVRILHIDGRNGRTDSGYFNDPEAAAAALAPYSGERAPGVYITMNPVNPALLSRAANRIQSYAKTTTSDNDVPRYRRLLIDIDAIRASGICATDDEQRAARQRAKAIAAYLADQGWPGPRMKISSGNGAYLVYGLDLPNDGDARQLVKRTLEALDAIFSGDAVKVDTGVGNPARIMRIPGTWNAKGDDTPERPWRPATGWYDDDAGVVPADLLERVAAQAPHPEPRQQQRTITATAGQRSWKIGDVLTDSGMAHSVKEQSYGTVYALADVCLTSDDHTDGASIIERPDRMLLYSCRHDRCQGKTWHDAKQHPRLKLPDSTGQATGRTARDTGGDGGGATRREPAGRAPRVAIVRSLADVEAKPIEWLWRGWLPGRMLTLLGGYGGDGKSTLLASLIATFSHAGTLPDGSKAPLVNTLMLAAEDDAEYAIRPRLDRHRADAGRVFLLEGTRRDDGERAWFDLQRDCSVMRDVIADRGIGLVVIDPLSSYMPKSDRNSEGDVRDALAPLATLMDETGVAIIGVMHVGKADGGRRVVQRLMGSTAFTAMARSVWAIHDLPEEHQSDTSGPDDVQPKRKVLGIVKSNYSIPPAARAFSIPLDGAIRFHGESPVTIEAAFNGEAGGNSRAAEAEAWLADYLKGGAKPANDVFEAGKAAGHSGATLKRVRTALGITSQKGREPLAPWCWSLSIPAKSEDAQAKIEDAQAQIKDAHAEIEDAHMSTLNFFPENRDVLPSSHDQAGGADSDQKSKMLKSLYISNLSTFDSGHAEIEDAHMSTLSTFDAGEEPAPCTECGAALEPGRRYRCEACEAAARAADDDDSWVA